MAKKKICNTCVRERPIFVFDKNDKCDFCRRNDERDKPKGTPDYTWDDVRQERNLLLEKSDWTMLKDADVELEIDYKPYRKKLKDITDDYENPEDVVWPDEPTQKKKTVVINKRKGKTNDRRRTSRKN